jgi:hypothetical protein
MKGEIRGHGPGPARALDRGKELGDAFYLSSLNNSILEDEELT